MLGQNCKPKDLQPLASSVPKGQSGPRGGGKNGEKLRPDLRVKSLNQAPSIPQPERSDPQK